MADTQHFCLRWNNYQSSITSAFENLRDDEDFVDVTLACDGKSLKAHRVVLSACSPYFRELLKSTPCKHPVIVLQDVAFADLHALVEFIYHGEVNVHQRNLSSFLKTAEVLRVSGLTQKAEEKEEDLSQPQNSGRSNQHAYSDKLVDDGLFASPQSPLPQGAAGSQLMRRVSSLGHRERHNSGDFSDISDQHSPNKRGRPGEGLAAASNSLDNATSAPNLHGTPSSPFPPKQLQGHKPDDVGRDGDESRSPPATDGVKSEPMELFGDGENSTDSVHDDVDGVQALQAASPYLSAASESKLFASATPSGSFNFSMAALAADATNLSNLNAQPLPPNSDGTPGMSSQGSPMRYHIPPPTVGGINEPQECPYCRRTFSCYYSLKRHFQDKHERSDTMYVCEFCQRRYRTKNSLTTHKSLQHRGSSGMLKRLLKSAALAHANH